MKTAYGKSAMRDIRTVMQQELLELLKLSRAACTKLAKNVQDPKIERPTLIDAAHSVADLHKDIETLEDQISDMEDL